MRKLVSLLLVIVLCLSVAGCGREIVTQQDSEVVNDTDGKEEEVDILPMNDDDAGEVDTAEESNPTDSDIWNQCLEMEDNAVLDTPIEFSIKGVVVDPEWTLSDFIHAGLVTEGATIEVKTSTEVDGVTEYKTVNPTLNELTLGVNGIFASIITDEFMLVFDASQAGIEESTDLTTLDIPVTHIIASSDFMCNGITPESSREDVAEVFGPTRWNGTGMIYTYKDSESYIEFSCKEGMPMEIFWDIGDLEAM